jgi:hypothetical protein
MAKRNRRGNKGGVGLDTSVKHMKQRLHQLEQFVGALGNNVTGSRKTKFGGKSQGPILGMTRAICAETIDPWKENRVRFYHPLLHDPETPVLGLPFAKPVSTMGGFDDCGLNWVPPAGSTLCMMFENGARDAPFYIGTTWHRDRGPAGSFLGGVPMREYKNVSDGHRKGYTNEELNDEHQVLPPWNTESYNAKDIDDFSEFSEDSTEQKRATYPNIYGFKTPEKHMVKLVDGNAKCNRRHKRLEIQSGCGNFMIFKDDHLHYGGQWGHPKCSPDPGGSPNVGETPCSEHDDKLPYFTDFHGKPIEGESKCKGGSRCNADKGESCDKIIGGHPSTPFSPPPKPTKYPNTNKGQNKFYKHLNECRPISGPGTPQNNKMDLPQSGIQFLSISGHSWVMDDSVEEPRGKPEWERSLEPFDFGCNDKYLGLMYQKSATGHAFEMSDVEEDTGIRSDQNWIRMLSANGNKIELNDHTFGSPVGMGECNCNVICPPRLAGAQRGIHLQSTSDHVINMVDHLNEQCSPCRCEGGTPVNKATQAFIQVRSGYGLEQVFRDDFSQQQTQQQYIQITNPQCARAEKDNPDPFCNKERGPHFLHMRAQPQGSPGLILLRAGGHYMRSTYDSDFVFVGDREKNPSDKFTYVSRNYIDAVEQVHFRYAGELHIFFAEKQILLMAGRDCPPPPDGDEDGPCLFPVVVGRCAVICPYTNITHWTDTSLSERVFASAHSAEDSCI